MSDRYNLKEKIEDCLYIYGLILLSITATLFAIFIIYAMYISYLGIGMSGQVVNNGGGKIITDYNK